jgi:ATP-dependent Clp protease adaptor protein ClpS
MSLRQYPLKAPERNEARAPVFGEERRSAPADPQGNSIVQTKPLVEKPPLYKVFLLNDDYTPMDFVTTILETIFHKSSDDATRIMLHVHKKGLGLCGVYSREIAETKVMQVMDAARLAEHPLQCKMERE